MERLKSIYRILCILLLVGILVPVGAQNNPYKIDDSLYPIYQRATKFRTRAQGVQIADTLYAEAIKKNDKKAQCLALTIPVIYAYNNHSSYETLEQATNRLKDVSRKNDYLQYYYFACSYEINYLLSNGRSLAALQKAEEVKEQAFKDRHAYGIFSCIRTIGNIYSERGNREQAILHYRSALDYMLEFLPEQDPSPLYLKIAQYYRGVKNKESDALEYIEKAIKEAKTDENRVSAMLDKCLTLWGMRREEEFRESYKECLQTIRSVGLVRRQTLERLRICLLISDGKYDEAHELTERIESPLEKYRLQESIYVRASDYVNAYYAMLCYFQHNMANVEYKVM